VPVFIAIFNALGEMPQFVGQEFLWIKNLAYPDAVFSLGFTIPWLGNTFNLTPFLMAVTAIVAALTYKLEHVDHVTLKAKRRQLVYMGIVFLILFFPFPAAMTFYWFLANVLQLIEQNVRYFRRTGKLSRESS
jgi:membrane protein insertase Oxa1/YidC/SpoIIIJ